jgi:hypothetical protein
MFTTLSLTSHLYRSYKAVYNIDLGVFFLNPVVSYNFLCYIHFLDKSHAYSDKMLGFVVGDLGGVPVLR